MSHSTKIESGQLSSTADHVPESHILEEYGDFADDYEETLEQYGYVSDKLAPAMVQDALQARLLPLSAGRTPAAATAPGAASAPGADGPPPAGPWRVLDLGCGTGNASAPYFSEPDRYSVVGVDLTPEMVEKARERPFERLICQNVEGPLDVEDGSFDAVQLIGVTEFLNSPTETFSEARRKLKPDGLLLFTSPQKIERAMELKYKIKTWLPGELEAHAQGAGFSKLREDRWMAYNLGDVAVQYQCSLWQR